MNKSGGQLSGFSTPSASKAGGASPLDGFAGARPDVSPVQHPLRCKARLAGYPHLRTRETSTTSLRVVTPLKTRFARLDTQLRATAGAIGAPPKRGRRKCPDEGQANCSKRSLLALQMGHISGGSPRAQR
jgi:hypothetical protein